MRVTISGCRADTFGKDTAGTANDQATSGNSRCYGGYAHNNIEIKLLFWT